MKRHTLRLAVPTLVLSLCVAFPTVASADAVVQAQRSVIISGHPEATRLGMKVLKDGGNAVDALVTVSLALGVAEPGNSGPGGKLVMLYYDAKTKDVSAMIALPTAPLGLDVDKAAKLPAAQKKRGWTAVCTPGLVAGLAGVHEKWGTKPWGALVRPAAELAENGVMLNALAAEMLAEYPEDIDATAAAIYAPGGKHPGDGDVLKNAEMAATLRAIADGGAKAFYEGDVAKKLVAAAHANGSPLSMEDLAGYRPRFLRPLSTTYHGYEVISGPPPSTGGATMLLSLACLEQMGSADGRPRDAAYIDRIGRAMQQVYPAVGRAAGDTAESADRVAKLFDGEGVQRLARRAKSADPRHPYPETGARTDAAREMTSDDSDQACTTHLIIVDAAGDIVCATQSLGYHFGAGVVAPGTGFLLNNDMNNFAYLTKGTVNYVAPGKMPRSTMTPTIVLKDGAPVLAIGSPAGARIPTAVLQCVVDVIDFKRPLAETISAPRFHVRRAMSSNDPANVIDIEKAAPAGLEEQLQAKGWTAKRRSDEDFYFGAVNATQFLPGGKITGVADQRRTGDAGAD